MSAGVLLRLRTVSAEAQDKGKPTAAILTLEPGERIVDVVGSEIGGYASFAVVTALDLADDE